MQNQKIKRNNSNWMVIKWPLLFVFDGQIAQLPDAVPGQVLTEENTEYRQ
jgi:hypothetical protein